MPALANSLTWERWNPCTVAVPPQLLRGTVSLGALAFGSVGVSLAALAGLDSPFRRRIRRTSYAIVLRRYVGWALLAGLALALVGLVCLHRIGPIRLFPVNDPEHSAKPPS